MRGRERSERSLSSAPERAEMRATRYRLLALLVLGCGAAGQERRHDAGALTAERLYPLREGNAWSYDVESESDDAPTLLVNRIAEVRGRRVVVETGGAPIAYEVRRDGIYWPDKGGY